MGMYTSEVQKLYIAYFNRPGDPAGVTYWENQLAGGATMTQVANSFSASAEYQAIYTGKTSAVLVDTLYQNLFGRVAQPADLAFWVGEMAAGRVTITTVASALASGTTAGSVDNIAILNKIAAATAFSAEVDTPAEVTGYTGTAAFASAATWLSAVKDPATLATATAPATLSAAVAASVAASAPSQTFMLTTSATDNLVGTANTDAFTAVTSSVIADGTLQASDKIDGGDGADSLSIDMSQGFTGFSTGSVKNVETISLVNKSTAALNFNATGVTGATKYVVDGTKAAVSLSNLATLAAIELTGPAATATFDATYDATSIVATGSQTDTQSLKLTNVGTIDSDGVASTTNAKALTVNIAKVEALTVTTAGTANTVNLGGVADAKAYILTGAGQTEVQAVGAAITSFDASGATGNVIVNLTAAATGALKTVKTGAGDDTVVVDASDLTATATVDGGAGKDSITLNGAGGTLQPTFTGFETVGVSGLTGALIFSGTNTTGIEAVRVSGNNTTNDATFVNMGASALSVTTSGSAAGGQNINVSADNTGAVVFNANAAATSTATLATNTGKTATFDGASSLTINVGEYADLQGNVAAGAAKALTINVASKVVGSVELSMLTATVTAAEATSFAIKADGQLVATSKLTAAKATTGTLTTGASSAADFDIAATKLNTLTVTAGNTLDLTGSTLTGLQNLTASVAKGLLSLNALDDAVSVVLSGDGATSAATLSTLGKTDGTLTHNVNLTASGLKANLVTKAINAGIASVGIDVSAVTGNVTLDAINADAGITLNAKNLGGTLGNAAAALTTKTGAISVDVSSALKAVTLGALTTNGTGDVTVLAGNALSTVTTGVITGKNVTVTGTGALGAVKIGSGVGGGVDINATTSVTYAGTNLTNNGVDIATGDTSTAFTANLTGGGKDETITIAGGTKQESITVSGNLGAGTNSVTITLANNATASKTQVINLSGLTGSDKTTTTTTTNLSAEIDGAITFSGSAMNDKITVVAVKGAPVNVAATVVIGDVTLTDSDTLTLDTTAAAITYSKLDVNGIENLVLVNGVGNAITLNASSISGDTIKVTAAAAATLNLTATAGADVISLVNLTGVNGAGDANVTISTVLAAGGDTFIGSMFKDVVVGDGDADTITGGKGADDLAGGAGNDTFIYAVGDADVIGFTAVKGLVDAPLGTDKFTGNEVIRDLITGDKINTGNASLITDAGTVGTLEANEYIVLAGGLAAGVFTVDGAGTDSILIYDADAATAGVQQAAIVLVGVAAAEIAAITNTAGVLATFGA